MRVFDVYTNILKCMRSTRFNGGSARAGASLEAQLTSNAATPPLIRTLDTFRQDKHRKWEKGSKEASDK